MNIKQAFGRLFNARAAVLMYHRISDTAIDPWGLSVSEKNFENQLMILKDRYNVIPVNELIQSIQTGTLAKNTVCITFDDGYCDNYHVAVPLLEKYELPATFYIASWYIDKPNCYWWDKLSQVFLTKITLPPSLEVNLGHETVSYDLGSSSIISKDDLRLHHSWFYSEQPPTRRCEIYLRLWERLKPLPLPETHRIVEEIKVWAKEDGPDEYSQLPMSTGQLNAISSRPLFDIGAHTSTHPDLSCLSTEMQFGEISDNLLFLQKHAEMPVTTISYPYGQYNEHTPAIVKELHLQAAFTTEEKAISSTSDPYRLGRFQVENWDKNFFEKKLDTWI